MRAAAWLEAAATFSKLVSADMASLPPLRARAVSSIFSDCERIDDAVRRLTQQPEENGVGCDGESRLHEFVRGVDAR